MGLALFISVKIQRRTELATFVECVVLEGV